MNEMIEGTDIPITKRGDYQLTGIIQSKLQRLRSFQPADTVLYAVVCFAGEWVGRCMATLSIRGNAKCCL